MEFSIDPRTRDLVRTAHSFLHDEVIPAEAAHRLDLTTQADPWRRTATLVRLTERARELGLWNLFLRSESGLGNVQYAAVAEISGWSPNLMPAAMNCNAPDSGNMELLHDHASEPMRRRWLAPLLDGSIRSAFCMTEPHVASSDARNIECRIVRDGDHYEITGEKWFISGAMSPEAEVLIVMGKTDPEADPRRQQSMIIVPRDTPGVRIERAMTVLGHPDHDHGGHAHIRFDRARVPVDHLLVGEGEGFAIAQARLGPGRIHHCMRLLGMAERALAIAGERAWTRTAFGGPLAERGVVREFMAESRIMLESLRLLVLKTAWLMDTVGNREAHTEIQAIKIAVPRAVQRIIDETMQLCGAEGLSQDSPLTDLFVAARGLRLADGPDAVHLATLGRAELRKHRPTDAQPRRAASS